MTEMSKSLKPGEVRTATATDGRQVKIMHAAGGSLFYVEARAMDHTLIESFNSRWEDEALRKFETLAR